MRPRYTSVTILFLILVFVCIASVGTAAAQPGGRLIVLRAPNFGWNLALNLQVDGRTVANVVQGRRYDHFVPAGRHVLTALGRAKLLLLSADIDRAQRAARADVRIHGNMAGHRSCCSRPISPASGTGILDRTHCSTESGLTAVKLRSLPSRTHSSLRWLAANKFVIPRNLTAAI